MLKTDYCAFENETPLSNISNNEHLAIVLNALLYNMVNLFKRYYLFRYRGLFI